MVGVDVRLQNPLDLQVLPPDHLRGRVIAVGGLAEVRALPEVKEAYVAG